LDQTKAKQSKPGAGSAGQVEERSGTRTARRSYHHGDLREALIEATARLIEERGGENFTLADACRHAGVSTAAPYKHFRDREEILEIIVSRAFDEMSERSVKAANAAGLGTLESMAALGETYIGFALEQPALFRLMFGQHPKIKSAEPVVDQGRGCFGKVIEQVAIYCEMNEIEGDPTEIATRMWTFVHGAASLLIDCDYEIVVPDLDIQEMIRKTTPMLLPPPKSAD